MECVRGQHDLHSVQRQGAVPNMFTYHGLVGNCERRKQPKWALELFEAMWRRDVPAMDGRSVLVSYAVDIFKHVWRYRMLCLSILT